MPVFSSIVAILFSLNCQKQDFTECTCDCQQGYHGFSINLLNRRSAIRAERFCSIGRAFQILME